MTSPVRHHPVDRTGTHTGRIGTPEHFRWLRGIVLTVIVLNVVDAVLTILWVSTGAATEANPMMADLVTDDPALFVTIKPLLVGLGSIVLWRLRRRRIAVVAIFLGFLAYYFVLLYHLQALNLRLVDALFG